MEICSIILSAGKGSRMHSDTAKPLHTISGKPMIDWVIDAAETAGIQNKIIVIPENNKDFKEISKTNKTVIQKHPLGTGDAVKKATTSLQNFNGLILVCFADTPFIKTESLTKILNTFDDKTKLVITGFRKIEKNNYGKIFFANNLEPIEIVEQKDCEEKNIYSEFCNGGIMCFHSSIITDLDKIKKNKITGEFYLTDLVNILFKSEKKISFVEIEEEEILGINNQIDLSIAEKIAQNSLRKKAMLNGVKMIDPNSVFLNFDTKLQKNVVIHPNVVFGKNVTIEENVEIKSFSHIEECKINEGAVIGPFARIRGESILGKNTKIGNFVEIKKSKLSENVKVNHLSYIGDAEIGSSTNIGAGTITCNYDGSNKNKTVIGNNSFIGSNSTIIAPIQIGNDVVLGAGSTFNKKIPDKTLSIGRAHQVNKPRKEN